jgi:iron(III) transport system permease protein
MPISRSASPIFSVADRSVTSGLFQPLRAGKPLARRGSIDTNLLNAIIAAYLALTALYPLSMLVAELFRGAAPPWVMLVDILSAPATFRALVNTVDSAAWSSVLAALIGTSAAIVVALTDIRLKGAASFLVLLPLLVPSQIMALAWKELFSIAAGDGARNPLYSREGVILVLGIEHSTAVFLSVRANLRGISRDLIEAARASGAGPLRVIRTVLLPLVAPGILAGVSISFVGAIGNFGVPALLGIPGRYPVLSTLIYRKLSGFGPAVLGETAVLSVVLIALAGAGLALRTLASRGIHATMSAETGTAAPFLLGRWRLPVETLLWVLFAGISILPFMALAYSSLIPAVGVKLTAASVTLANYRFVLLEQEAIIRAFGNSVSLSLLAAMGSAIISIPLAYLAVVRRNRLARILDIVSDAPYAIPGIVLSIAMILAFIRPLPLVGSLYGTSWILLIAYLARFLAPAARTVVSGLERFDVRLEEAAQVAGAGMARRLFTVILPAAAPAAGAGALIVFMQAVNELTVSSLLWSTGNETIGVMIYSLQYEGNSTAAAAVSMLSIAMILFLAAVFGFVGRNLPEGVVPWRS